MSRKRRNTSSPESEESPKRLRPSWVDDIEVDEDYAVQDEQVRTDAYTGQKGAFPGVNTDDDELFYGPASNGIEYLRMVRSEAKGVPHLLVAGQKPGATSNLHKEEIEAEQEDYYDGFYEDEAYTAPILPSTENTNSPSNTQIKYYDSLLDKFNIMRRALNTTPPLTRIELLSSGQPISFPSGSQKARERWTHVLNNTQPTPTQIACMDMDSILELMTLVPAVVANAVRSQDSVRIKRVGAWTWAALAKCKDRGELGSEEISVLRDLGKMGVELLRSFAEVRREDLHPQADALVTNGDGLHMEECETFVSEGEQGQDGQEVVDGIFQAGTEVRSVEDAKARLSGMLNVEDEVGVNEKEGAKLQAGVLLDMIVTVVGEVYGQRDLLEHRDVWASLPIQS